MATEDKLFDECEALGAAIVPRVISVPSFTVLEMAKLCADLRTADGIKRALRGNLSDASRQSLENLLYAAGRLEGIREATERVAL